MASRKNNLEVRLDTDLREFARTIMRGRRNGTVKKEVSSSRVVAMLGYLYDGNDTLLYVTRKIHTVGELYSFGEEEIRRFKGYKKKTWRKLSEILTIYGLPPLKLPQEYISDR